MEHCYQRASINDNSEYIHNRIQSHERRLRFREVQIGQEGKQAYLTHLVGDAIQWKLPWITGRALLRRYTSYFIEQIELEGIQPYAPLRVLRQFKIEQNISFMVGHGYNRSHLWKRGTIGQNQKTTRNMDRHTFSRNGQTTWCITGYYAWKVEGSPIMRPRGSLGW